MTKSKRRCLLNDIADFTSLAVKSIHDDNFSKCFTPKKLEKNRPPIKYGLSIILRYFFVLPLRILILGSVGLIISIYLVLSIVSKSEKGINNCFLYYSKLLCFVFGAKIINHGVKPNLTESHIFVSNHTSVLDYLILSSYKFSHSCVVENHGGLFGFIFKFFLSQNGSLAFKRSNKEDKDELIDKINLHLKKRIFPMILFPEGTCVNNNNTVMFRRGVFGLNVKICPVTIKYDKNGFDPYWYRRKISFPKHIFYLLTRFSFVVDVYYHEPKVIEAHETPEDFAYRIKKIVNKTAKFKDVMWSGYLKNNISINDSRIIKRGCKMFFEKISKDNEEYCISNDGDYKYFGKYSYDEFMKNVTETTVNVGLNKENRNI